VIPRAIALLCLLLLAGCAPASAQQDLQEFRDEAARIFEAGQGQDVELIAEPPRADLEAMLQLATELERRVAALEKKPGCTCQVAEDVRAYQLQEFASCSTGRSLRGFNGMSARQDLVDNRGFTPADLERCTEAECRLLLGALIDRKLPPEMMPGRVK
jgi:hypothetical protein